MHFGLKIWTNHNFYKLDDKLGANSTSSCQMHSFGLLSRGEEGWCITDLIDTLVFFNFFLGGGGGELQPPI